MTKCLVIGFGSVGMRHARILHQAGHDVSVVSRRSLAVDKCFSNIPEAVECQKPAYVVVSNETSAHFETVRALAECGYSGQVLIEKPIFGRLSVFPDNMFSAVYCAYHLRFHPLLVRLREALAGERILTFNSYVGQYLPDWRPDTDYRSGYSAQANLGGGALADLSHELDFANWVMGGWCAVAARGGHYSDLEITSDDCFSILLETRRCHVATVHLNYLNREKFRQFLVNTDVATYRVDLVSGIFTRNEISDISVVEHDAPYMAMHNAILNPDLPGDTAPYPCTLNEALDVVELMEAARSCAGTYNWSVK